MYPESVWILMLITSTVYSLENGLARKPPMGWSSWMVFECNINCANPLYDTNCVNEVGITTIMETLKDDYLRAGYDLILIDDCWQELSFNHYELQPSSNRFRSHISSLATKAHQRGLKLGIFSDLGPTTGGQFPGSLNHLETDAQTFARWGVDYVKMSACSEPDYLLETDYRKFGDELRRTGRNIVYAVSLPVYEEVRNKRLPNYNTVAEIANTWRFTGDIVNNWDSILRIMDAYALRQSYMTPAIRAGSWADPDVLVIGNSGITLDQARTQMAIWAMMAAPLIISTNIITLENATYKPYKDILLNKDIIDIDQDSLAIAGTREQADGAVDIWVRRINPIERGYHSYAIAFVNRNQFYSTSYTITLRSYGLNCPDGYYIQDLYTKTFYNNNQPVLPDSSLTAVLNPCGVVIYKARAAPSSLPFPNLNTGTRYY